MDTNDPKETLNTAATPQAASSPAPDAAQIAEEPSTTASETTASQADAETHEKPVDGTQEKPAVTQAEPNEADDASLPFHEHPRFQQLIRERNDLRPLAERSRALDKFLTDNSISNEKLMQVLDFTVLLQSDPAEALKRLRPQYEQLQAFAGEAVPPELQAKLTNLKRKLDEGVIDRETYDEFENSLRTQAKNEAAGRFRDQRQQDAAQMSRTQAVTSALASWESDVIKRDPAYKTKENLVLLAFKGLAAATPIQTPQDAIRLAEQALKQVNDSVSAMLPKKKATKPLLDSTGSSGNVNGKPLTFEQACEAAASKYAGGD